MLPHTGLFLLGKVALQMRIRRRLKFRHSRENGNPAPWEQKLTPRHSRERGNPVTEKPQESIGKNRNPRPSFPRTRESRT
ncbi:hypothetical protein GWC82_11475 [Neisseria meningitidis]|nr:hypothetical protein [Neisseria meningitidis]